MTPLSARIGHDIGDFADLLVRRAAQAGEKPRAQNQSNKKQEARR